MSDMIIIVDDEKDAGRTLRERMRMLGLDAYYLKDPKAVPDIINKVGARVLITDFWMDGLTGADLAIRVRKECPTVEVIVIISGEASNPFVREAAEKADCPLAEKPISREDVENFIKRFNLREKE